MLCAALLCLGSGSLAPSAAEADAATDTAPPALTEFFFTPKTADVSTGARQVTVVARVTDATGAEAPTMVLASDDTSETLGLGSMARISGTAFDGIYRRTVTVPTTAAPGAWNVTVHPLVDILGNSDGTFHHHPTRLTVVNPPATAPDPPTGVTARPRDGSARVVWTASLAGSPITSYTVTATPGGRTVTVPGGTTSARVSRLRNGTAYTFTVTATNPSGSSPHSAPSRPVTPATTPGRVAEPAVGVTGRKVVVRWRVPRDGGAALTGYRVILDGERTRVPASTVRLVRRNLSPGLHRIRVAAINRVGTGRASRATWFRVPRPG